MRKINFFLAGLLPPLAGLVVAGIPGALLIIAVQLIIVLCWDALFK